MFLDIPKRALNLLGCVNKGCGLLLARGLEKRQPVALVNTPEKIECSLLFFLSCYSFPLHFAPFPINLGHFGPFLST